MILKLVHKCVYMVCYHLQMPDALPIEKEHFDLFPQVRSVRLSRTEVAEIQRWRIFRAMASVMSEKGYSNVTVADVVAKAGISRRTFYEHFLDKENCFIALVEEVSGFLSKTMGGVGVSKMGPVALLERVIHVYLSALSTEPEMARAILVECYGVGGKAVEIRVKSAKQFEESLSMLVKYAKSMGLIKSEGSQDIEMVAGAVRSLVTLETAQGKAHLLLSQKERIIRFISKSLGIKAE